MNRERTIVDCKVVHIEIEDNHTIFDIGFGQGEFKGWHFVGDILDEPIQGATKMESTVAITH